MCSAGSRLLVQDSIKDAMLEKIAAVGRSMKPGDPLDPATKQRRVERDHQRVRSAIAGVKLCGHRGAWPPRG